ncbi:MAG: hypothetical protein LJE70_14970 [Chromatiaceae bacterium]|nr:hypothetical protein [Chromatiaceae bacterium]
MLTLITLLGLVRFVVRALSVSRPIVDVHLFRDRNLVVTSGMMLVFGLGLFVAIAVQPIMLERMLGYPAEAVGLVMAPRPLGSAFSMAVVARLISRLDLRWLVRSGMGLPATDSLIMSGYDPGISPTWVIWPSVLQGMGMGPCSCPCPLWPMAPWPGRCWPMSWAARPRCRRSLECFISSR